MYASLIISLLSAFVAMLGKQWLNRYLRNSGGSTIERCGDRQRKCDGLEKWPLHFFIESLPVMLQAALLLLACGLCRHMWSIDASVARTLIGLAGLGVMFYIGIVIAGMSSYACPFQTPASLALRSLWKRVRHGIVFSIVFSKRVLSRTHQGWNWIVRCGAVSFKRAFSWTRQMWNRRVRQVPRRQSPPTIPLESVQVQQSEPVSMPGEASQSESVSVIDNVAQYEPWLKLEDLASIRRTNIDDVRCVSWILRNITDPEALDAAIRLAGEIRWFDDGTDVNVPYDTIVSTFKACFDSTRTLYPGSRDRAYYSGRAMMWINTLARCKSEDFAGRFPLLHTTYTAPTPDPDLRDLLSVNSGVWYLTHYITSLLATDPGHTPPHSQWISNLLLHHSWATRTELNYRKLAYRVEHAKTTIPLNAILNRLLVWCTLLGSPVEEEVLKIRDKSYGTSYSCSSTAHYSSPAIASNPSYTNCPKGFVQQ
jgi:hypothetical protein